MLFRVLWKLDLALFVDAKRLPRHHLQSSTAQPTRAHWYELFKQGQPTRTVKLHETKTFAQRAVLEGIAQPHHGGRESMDEDMAQRQRRDAAMSCFVA